MGAKGRRCRICRSAPATHPRMVDPPRYCGRCWGARQARLDEVGAFAFDRHLRAAGAEGWFVRHPGVAAHDAGAPDAACAELLAFEQPGRLAVTLLLFGNLPWDKTAVQMGDDDAGVTMLELLLDRVVEWARGWSLGTLGIAIYRATEEGTVETPL